jgi:hypothetical protein
LQTADRSGKPELTPRGKTGGTRKEQAMHRPKQTSPRQGGDTIPAGTFHGGDTIPAGTFHGSDTIPAGTFHVD